MNIKCGQMWARRGRGINEASKLSIVKHQKWNQIMTHTATTHTAPLSPSGTSQTHTETPSPFPPHQQDKVFRKKSVFRAQSSPSPYSRCLANYGLAGLGPKLAGYYLPPFSHACPFLPSFSPHHRRTDRDTHTSFYNSLYINS